jgi:hypothetical protein
MSQATRKALVEAGIVFVAALILGRWQIEHWGGLPDFDGNYHLRVVQWLAHHGLWTDIPWLPFTVLGERGPDHHWLWHVALLPFAWLNDAQALPWAAAFNGAAAIAVIAFVMRLLGVPAAPLFAVLAVTADGIMPMRLLMLRTQNAAVIYMVLAVWAIARRRDKTLGLLAFLFMESYHAGVIMAPISVIGAAARSMAERRVILAPVTAVGAGLALALLISPWFPRNVEYLMFHLFFKTPHSILGEHISALIGTEWYPPGWRRLLIEAWPAHLMLGAACAALAWRRARVGTWLPPADTLIAVGIAFLSLALYWKAARFAEYYVPFAALAAGLAARDAGPPRYGRRHAVALATWVVVAASVGVTGLQTTRLMPADHLAQVGERLNELGRPGDTVFNSSWSDLMALVWWADAFRYVNGLDGHYLAYRDPARFAIWLAASAGALDNPAAAIAEAFDARFVVVARQHERLAKQLMRSPSVRLRVTSPSGWLFELIYPEGR